MFRKGKCLFLHGYGESSMTAKMSTTALKKALDAANFQLLEVPDGWVKLESDFDFEPINDKEYAEMCQKGELDAYCWWPLRDPRTDPPAALPRRAKPHKQFAFPLMHTDKAEEADKAPGTGRTC